MQDISNTTLKGIRKFLEIYPLKRPHVIDIQRYTDPNEKFGSVLLPLLQKTMESAPGSPHWVLGDGMVDVTTKGRKELVSHPACHI